MSDAPDNSPPPMLAYPAADPATTRRSVRVAQFANELQAAFVANLLERAAIPTFLFNATGNANGPVPGLTPVELHVRPEDADQAAAIVADLAAGRIPVADDDAGPTVDDDADDDPRCPKCRSWQVRPHQSLKEDLLRFLRLLPPTPPGVTTLECWRCGHRWVELAQQQIRAAHRTGSEDSDNTTSD